MLNLLDKINKRKEYETLLLEYSRPIMHMNEGVSTSLMKLKEVSTNFVPPIYCHYYWYPYFESMLSEVLIPLIRVFSLTLKERVYPIFFDESFGIDDITPCTYREAFEFFKDLSISDRKAILNRWASSLSYVNILDCIERDDFTRFIALFAEIDNVAQKLGMINLASCFLPLMKMMDSLYSIFSKENPSTNERIIKDFENFDSQIAESYDWSKFESLYNLIEDVLSDLSPDVREIANNLKTDQWIRTIYEQLVYPCVKATDFTNPLDVERIEQVYGEWGNRREFVYFWKDLADLLFAVCIFVIMRMQNISLSEKEKVIIEQIINNEEKEISPSHLNAIVRWTKQNWCQDQATPTQQCLPQTILSDYDKVKAKGMPYFETAKAMGLITVNGEYLSWTKSKVLLEYFCGRIYCGDHVQVDTYSKYTEWKTGGSYMPVKELQKLFNMIDFGQQRRNRINNGGSAPKRYEIIDAIYDKVMQSFEK